MESTEDGSQQTEEKICLSAAQRRAEIRRRKLLMNSEDRMNRIVGFSKPASENNGDSRRPSEPRFHLDLLSPSSSQRLPPHPPSDSPGSRGEEDSPLPDSSEVLGGEMGVGLGGGEEEEVGVGVRQRPRGGGGAGGGEQGGEEPHRAGLQKYLSRFDEAMRLRGQLANERQAREAGAEPEEMETFRLVRMVGSVLLGLVVRGFVCHYLSIFAPFLTLELAYMGLYKYFPRVEKKSRSTVLTAALLLSGIPAEVISRSTETYRKMADVFADLCLYFFTFVIAHEGLLLIGSGGEGEEEAMPP